MLDFSEFVLDEASDLFEENIDIEQVNNQDIAIIGIGLKFPLVNDLDEYWRVLKDGVDCVRSLPAARKRDADQLLSFLNADDKSYSYFEGGYLEEIDKFDAEFFRLSPAEAELMDPNQRLFLETVWSAIEDAGYGGTKLIGSNTGVFLGFSPDLLANYRRYIFDIDPLNMAVGRAGNITSIIAGRMAYLLDLKGPSMVVDTACSSSLAAVHLACQSIRTGESDMAIAGCSKLMLLPLDMDVKIGIESSDARTKAFDDASDGTGLGEGVSAIVLKPLHKALRDRDSIHAVIKGSACQQDGRSAGLTAPNADAQTQVLTKAWRQAGINPETIGYIEAHGTGTKLGDPIEIEGIRKAFQKFTTKRQFCGIGSLKSNFGHLDHAAGLAGLIKAVLALKHKKLPPTLHFTQPNRQISFIDSPVYVNSRLSDWESDGKPRRCGVNAFGLSGTNCHVLLEEAPSTQADYMKQEDSRCYVFVLSTRKLSSLKKTIRSYIHFVENKVKYRLEDICYTLQTGRGHYQYRLAILTESIEDLLLKLRELDSCDRFDDCDNPDIFFGQDFGEEKAWQPSVISGMNEGNRLTELRQACFSYISGYSVRWESFHLESNPARVHMPTYVFDKQRYWSSPDHRLQASPAIKLTGRPEGEYSPDEIQIASIWGDVLKIEEVGLHDHFFEIGGDSIIALKLVSEMQKHYQWSINDMFRFSTICQQALQVQAGINHKLLRIEALQHRILSRKEKLELKDCMELEKPLKEYHTRLAQMHEADLSVTNGYNTLLLTGATGYLGIYLMRDLLVHTSLRLIVLVRGHDAADASERLRNKALFYFQTDLLKEFQDRLIVVNGDICQDRLGLEKAAYHELSLEVDVVLHAAAYTSYYGEESKFFEVNVEGTRRVLEFVKSGKMKDLHHISTLGIGTGKREGLSKALFTEFDCDQGQELNIHYARTKFIAEKMLLAAKGEGLNVSIYRIGHLICDSQTGRFQENIGDNAVYAMLKAAVRTGAFPDIERENIELCFIDSVSMAITLLLPVSALRNDIHHLMNPFTISFSALARMLNEVSGEQSMKLEPVQEYLRMMLDLSEDKTNADRQSFANQILLYLDMLHAPSEYFFATEKTERYLERLGFSWESVRPLHIERMLDHCKEVNFL
ncbi:beta-ketoacyl synthase N-terminal-like domain-containing protein [Paenibacillus rhizophilus]|uniref:NAD-dependent epimerase/dehydratase family protein n=1 Tax=Paenibacillus rhizophilus TaxID=1850366 RepID=A0A3N9P1S9_9BACL|nr:beta-ketoacyl synthase N-terminal-like domain-containing protein [Paenibacillus rhizophilus]RQW09679.1 NAD-dependent epimerase/dehydratase family protein [Paenibacillus rhizophilus]